MIQIIVFLSNWIYLNLYTYIGFQEEYKNLMKQKNEIITESLMPTLTVTCNTNTKSSSTNLCFSDNLFENDKVEIVVFNDSTSSSVNIDIRKYTFA